MDPNEALAKLRADVIERNRAADAWNEGDDPDDGERMDDIANEIAHQFEALDEWLTKGGFLPTEWARKHDELVRFVREVAGTPYTADIHVLDRLVGQARKLLDPS